MGEYSYTITDTGLAKIAAAAGGGASVDITQIAVGDGNGAYYTPLATQTALVNETKRVDINNRGIDSQDSNKLFFISKIAADDYGYAIRECGLFDAAGDLIAIRKYPLVDKTTQGNMIEVFLKEELIVTNTADFTLSVDPNVIISTQQYVADEINTHDTDPAAHYDVTQSTRGFMKPEDKVKLDNLNQSGFKTYCANSGNTDADGYADIIERVSDTEVSFKVGGAYPNLGVTFPNSKHYEISSIPNITGLADDALYSFVLFEENLTKLSDGTYSAIVTKVETGYTYIGDELSATGNAISNSNYSGTTAVMAFDSNESNYWSPNEYNANQSGVSYIGQSGLTKKVGKIRIVQGTTPIATVMPSVKVQWSSDGVSWTDIQTQTIDPNVSEVQFFLNDYAAVGTHYLRLLANANLTDTAQWVVRELEMYEVIVFPGGTITEDKKFPEAYDTAISPSNKTADSGVADGTGWTSSASQEDSGAEAWRLFDGVISGSSDWATINNPVGWVKIEKDSGTFNLSRVSITCNDTPTAAPKDFTIKDENDNVLTGGTITDQTGWSALETRYFDVTGTGIEAVKIDVTANNGYSGQTALSEVKLYTTISTAAGDLHLLINQTPLKPYLKQDTEWVEKQFVKLGEATKDAGAILAADVISYAFNGKTTLSQSITTGQTYSLTYNIGVNPNFIRWLGVHNNITGDNHSNLPNGTSGIRLFTGTGLGGVDLLNPTNKIITLKTMSTSIGQARNINFYSSTAVINFWRSF